MITPNLTVRRHTTYGFTPPKRERNKPRPCRYPWSCASSEPTAQRPHQGRTRTSPRRNVLNSVVYAVARQLCQYHRPIVAEELGWRSARAMQARIDSTNSDDTVCPRWRRREVDENSTRHQV